MRSPIARLAIAAALLLVTLLGLHFFAGTSHVAWASVLENIRSIDTYVYRVRKIESTGPRSESFEFVTEKGTTVYQSPTEGLLRVTSADELWQAQDEFMAAWPAYDEVNGRLCEELVDKLGIDQLDVEGLVATGIALRERFWALGGCLSDISYPLPAW